MGLLVRVIVKTSSPCHGRRVALENFKSWGGADTAGKKGESHVRCRRSSCPALPSDAQL